MILIFFSALPVSAQNATPEKRPTIGLVLSGGGARGFAHIGVLKVLEENHIPVDYIGGASMGALVGALYSMGKTPDEIEQLVGSLDWNTLFQPRTSFDNLSFRRKEDRRNIPAPITLTGKPNDLKLPNALNSGQEISLLFDRETLPYAAIRDFDNLPIPFRAVATDMLTGNSVTLKSGSLSQALRATMSIPGIFSPVEIDGKILGDGGLVNNIPTDVVKAMGADILIVVNIETQPGNREALESLPGVLAQTINISTLDNSRRSLRQADFIIAPDLGNYTLTDFPESQKIIELGYQGAEKKAALLKGLSLNDADWQAYLANRKRREIDDKKAFVPAFVAVNGKDKDATRTIEEKLGGKYINQPFDAEKQNQLAKDLTDLTGMGRFNTLDYDLTTREGKTGLVIRANQIGEIPSKPTRLEIGFDVNSVESDNVDFNFLSRLTFFDVGRYGAEWRNDLQLGSNTYLASEYYRPLGKTRFFIAPRISYERRHINLFDGDTRLAEYVGKRAQAGIDVGYKFDYRSELRAGYTIGYEKASRRIGDALLPDLKGNFSTVGLRWTYDGLDKAQVPTRGIYSRNTLNYYFDSAQATGKFTQAETRFDAFHSINDRNIIFSFGGGGTTFGNSAPLVRQFTLGGPLRLGGYGFDQFRSNNYLQAGVGILHNPKFFPTFLGGKAYLGAWYEGGSAFEKFNQAIYRQSVTGGAVFETPLGPVFFGGSVNENGRGRIYFSFGKFFR
ncbi:MAG: patatin-like phospholipase family protein [Pyrinomonadaceae bacterium]